VQQESLTSVSIETFDYKDDDDGGDNDYGDDGIKKRKQ
jgi:hypothetical protein